MANEEKLMANQAVEGEGNTNSRSNSKAAKNKGKAKQNKADITPQKLTLAEISKLAKEAQKYKQVSLFDGQYVLTVHENFLDDDIHNYLLDIYEALLILKSENVNMQDLKKQQIIAQMLLLKHFADIGLKHLRMDKKRDVSRMLLAATELTKIGVFQVIDTFFDAAEIKKIDEATKKIDEIGKQLGELMITATFNEQEKLRKLGLKYAESDSSIEDDIANFPNLDMTKKEDFNKFFKMASKIIPSLSDLDSGDIFDKLPKEKLEEANEIVKNQIKVVGDNDGESTVQELE